MALPAGRRRQLTGNPSCGRVAVAGLSAGPGERAESQREHRPIAGCSRSLFSALSARSADGHPPRSFRVRVRPCSSANPCQFETMMRVRGSGPKGTEGRRKRPEG
jgi:hypothetical protein